jgi:hypothetical protein
MQVYVDESGDSGMSGKPGSTPYFVVAAVLFNDDEAASECRRAIRELMLRLEWHPRQEFKFNKADHTLRKRFFETIAAQDFWYNAVVLNKKELKGPGFQFKDPFYKYTVRLVFTNAKPHLDRATVVMDQCGSRDFRDQMQSYLQKQVREADGRSPIRRVRTEKSHSCELVQMADMVVGAIARSFHPARKDARTYRDMIRHRELGVQFWPR